MVMAEEILKKGGVEYLGWQTGKYEFKNCYKEVIKIDGGTVQETKKKCKKREPRPLIVILGTVEDVNIDNRTFKLKDKSGQSHVLFFPEAAVKDDGVQLEKIKKGEEISVIVPITGRAETITNHVAKNPLPKKIEKEF
jgi:hypothetical protein